MLTLPDGPAPRGESRVWPVLVASLVIVTVGAIVLFSRERERWGRREAPSIIDPETSAVQESLSTALGRSKRRVPKSKREKPGSFDAGARRAVARCLPAAGDPSSQGFPGNSDALLMWLAKGRAGVQRREIRSRVVWLTLPKGQKRRLRIFRPEDPSGRVRLRMEFFAEDPLGKLLLLPIPLDHSENPARPVIQDYLTRGEATREDWSYAVWYSDGSDAEVDEVNGAAGSIRYRSPGRVLACDRDGAGRATMCTCNLSAPEKK